jgi:uncharacterized protein
LLDEPAAGRDTYISVGAFKAGLGRDGVPAGLMLTLLRLIVIAATLYVAFVALLYLMERTFLYPASSYRATAAEAGLAGFQDLTLTTADGQRLVAWWKAPEPGRSTLLYFHGNGGSL